MANIFERTRRRVNDRALPWVLKNKFDPDSISLSASRHVSLFPKLNLAFNRVKKNGNSTTMSILHAMEHGSVADSNDAKRQAAHLRRANPLLFMSAGKLFYVVIIRNPYSRLLSAFLNKFAKSEFVDKYGAFALTPDGFYDFLIWISESGLESDAHWDLQKKLILGPLDGFDAVLKFEEFPDCLENLLQSRGLELPDATQNLLSSVNKNTRTGASRKIAGFYTPEGIKIVQSLFRDDFEFLGYSNDFSKATN